MRGARIGTARAVHVAGHVMAAALQRSERREEVSYRRLKMRHRPSREMGGRAHGAAENAGGHRSRFPPRCVAGSEEPGKNGAPGYKEMVDENKEAHCAR